MSGGVLILKSITHTEQKKSKPQGGLHVRGERYCSSLHEIQSLTVEMIMVS